MGRSVEPRDEAGQAVVVLALALSGLLAAIGLGIDAGLQYVERRREQIAADAAAYAAAVALATNTGVPTRTALARASALEYAAYNGYDNNGATNTVTVSIPPVSGAYAGNADYAEVVIEVDVRTAFIRILGPSFATARVRGRAVGGSAAPPKSYAVMALSRSASPGLDVTGQAYVETDSAGIMVNTNASAAFVATGQAHIEVPRVGGTGPRGPLDVAGGTSMTGGVNLEATLSTGVAQQGDPLMYLVPPDGAGLPLFAAINATGSDNLMLDPGIYAGISVSGNARVTLRPGTYVIRGGGISVTGNGQLEDTAPLGSAGAFIYNACSNFPAAGGTCSGLAISGNGRVELRSLTAGPLAGMSIWQPCENTQTLAITGGGTPRSTGRMLETDGAIYAPCAPAQITGNGDIEVHDAQFIASTITATGNAELEVHWPSAASSARGSPAVVE